MSYQDPLDVAIIGRGRIGTEAAVTAARVGQQTLLLTHNIGTLGQMSYNPMISGIGKGHLVREMGALGGSMVETIDHAGIQSRILDANKRPAVRTTRARADRVFYHQAIYITLEGQPNLVIFRQATEDLTVENDRVMGVTTQVGLKLCIKTVILTMGTFLDDRIHIGLDDHSDDRAGDPSSIPLPRHLRELPLRVSRLKADAPPRIDARVIGFNVLSQQNSDSPMPVFSFLGDASRHPHQMLRYITRTNEKTHDMIRNNLGRSPMYADVIEGIGPHHCPSIEGKVIRFAGHNQHQIFLKLERLASNEIHPNGISTSLPFDMQMQIVRSMQGAGNARIVHLDYAIEYDFFNPRDLGPALENKLIQGLFFAGRISDTTGYEGTAAQGVLAGLNATHLSVKREGWAPHRDRAYLGVLVGDLHTLGVKGPYRMFISRAEYHSMLHEDNADLCLVEIGRELGLMDDKRRARFNEKLGRTEQECQRLESTWVSPLTESVAGVNAYLAIPLSRETGGEGLLHRLDMTYAQLASLSAFAPALNNAQAIKQIEIQVKCEGYIACWLEKTERQQHNENTLLSAVLDYRQISGLSNEAIAKLNDRKLVSINQAPRISGVIPAIISILLVWLKRQDILCRNT